jgi:hypothetical protein
MLRVGLLAIFSLTVRLDFSHQRTEPPIPVPVPIPDLLGGRGWGPTPDLPGTRAGDHPRPGPIPGSHHRVTGGFRVRALSHTRGAGATVAYRDMA